MRPWRRAAALLAVVAACVPAPSSPAPPQRVPEPTTEVPTERVPSFPGGGRILFLASRGPGYAWGKVGIIESNGNARYFPRDPYAFPYWDPAVPDRILMLPYGSDPTTRSFEIFGASLHEVDAWRTAELSTYPSLDGTTIAFTPIDRSGRPRRRILRLIDRSTDAARTVRSGGLVPLGWTPGRELIAAPSTGGHLVRWNPWTGVSSPFGPRHLSDVIWDPSGRRYASAIASSTGETESVVVIGRRNGRVTDRVPVGRRWVDMPTWSPDGTRIAFIVRGAGRTAHRRSSLHVYDLTLGIDLVVASPVSHARWASWSPDGDWLLVEDWTRDRWLFVAAAGDVHLPYPWLGAVPRWCCPSSPPSSTQIPVS
jgi:hypothetical protein